MNQLTEQVKNLARFAQEHAPALLTAAGAAGVITTAVLSAQAAVRANDTVIIEQTERGQFIDRKEKFALTWHFYIPPVLAGATTIACIVGAQSINYKRQAALLGLYSLSERALAQYQTAVEERYGEGKQIQVLDDVAIRQVEENPIGDQTILQTGYGTHLVYDMTYDRYFTNSIDRIKQVVNRANDELRENVTHITLNELFRRIGVPPVILGDDVGWTSRRLVHFNYTSTLDDRDRPCLVLNYRPAPIRGPGIDNQFYQEGPS